MGTKIDISYLGDFQTEITHGPTKSVITTDLPPDNGGKGRLFSPTDLFASSLGSCILTIMATVAERDGIDFKGTSFETEKIMSADPRRIGEVKIKINFNSDVTEAQKKKLLSCVKACPVHRSLHPEVKVTII